MTLFRSAGNWKLSVDSQVEGYHAATLHRRTLGDSLGGADNPMIHMLDFAAFGEKHRLSMPAGDSPERGAVDALASSYGPSISSYNSGKLSDLPPGVNQIGRAHASIPVTNEKLVRRLLL